MADSELGLLRDAYWRLDAKVSRYRLLRLSIATILVFTFANAFDRVDTEALDKNRTEYERLTNLLGDKSPIEDEKDPAKNEVIRQRNAVGRKIDAIYTAAYTLTFNIIGIPIKIDLRTWIYGFPAFLFCSEIWLQILRKKREMVFVLTSHSVAKSDTPPVSSLDRLVFSGRDARLTSFGRYPDRLLEFVYTLALLGLIAYLMVASLPSWSRLAGEAMWASGQMFLIVVSCGVVYLRHAFRALEGAVGEQIGWVPEKHWPEVFWQKVVQKYSQLTQKIAPRASLLTGSLLLLITLVLATSMTSCYEPRSGYDLVNGESYWPSDAESGLPLHYFFSGALVVHRRFVVSDSFARATSLCLEVRNSENKGTCQTFARCCQSTGHIRDDRFPLHNAFRRRTSILVLPVCDVARRHNALLAVRHFF
jgi:hypothetical protein